MQGHPSFTVPFHARDLRAAQAAAAVDADSQRAKAHGRLYGALHGTTKVHPALQLLSDILGDQQSVDLGLTDLDDVQVHLRAGHLGQFGAKFLDVDALLADDDTRPRRVDGDPRLLRRPLDDDARHAGLGQALVQEFADIDILVKKLGVTVLGVPPRIPSTVDAQAKADRVDLLSHLLCLPDFADHQP